VAYEAKKALPEICCRMKIHGAICADVSGLDWCRRAGGTHHRVAEISAPEAVVTCQQTKPLRLERPGRAAHMSSHDPLSAIFDSAMACSMASISMTVCPASTSISGRNRSSIARALSRCPCEMSHRGDSEPEHQPSSCVGRSCGSYHSHRCARTHPAPMAGAPPSPRPVPWRLPRGSAIHSPPEC
jgi:hypothetical protein